MNKIYTKNIYVITAVNGFMIIKITNDNKKI